MIGEGNQILSVNMLKRLTFKSRSLLENFKKRTVPVQKVSKIFDAILSSHEEMQRH